MCNGDDCCTYCESLRNGKIDEYNAFQPSSSAFVSSRYGIKQVLAAIALAFGVGRLWRRLP